MSMPVLGVEDAVLSPLPRAFLAGLGALLEELRPALLDPVMTKATARADGVEVVLAHACETDWSVWAQASRAGVVVGCAAQHSEHDDAAGALAVVRALLCGELEVVSYTGTRMRPDFR